MSFTSEYVARFDPWIADLQQRGIDPQPLIDYLETIASLFSEVELYAMDWYDDDGVLHEGWTSLFDPDLCPAKALPYLAQYVGEVLPEGLWETDEAAAREWINDNPNSRRGTNRAIFLAAQRRLTGSRLVSIVNRDGLGTDEDVDRLTVATYIVETPDPEGTRRDIESVAPYDVDLNIELRTGQSWGDVRATYASWTDVMNANVTWGEVAADLAGFNVFTRPRQS
jgi:hypothetical protein